MMIKNEKKLEKRTGAASLISVVLLTILIVILAIQFSTATLSEIFATSDSAASLQALQYAEAGAKDALLRLARNKNYTCVATDCYNLDVVTNGCTTSLACAKVSVTGTGASGDPKIITSKGIAGSGIRRVQVSVVYDASLFGEFQTVNWLELTN